MTLSDEINEIIRIPEVTRITGLSRATIYDRIQKQSFPAQIDLGGGRAVGWIKSEILNWVNTRIDESRNEGSK